MQFKIGPWVYNVVVCPGPVREDGDPVDAIAHERDILIAGDVRPADRSVALFDQLRQLWEQHNGGAITSAGVASFAIAMMRQLLAQGGEPTLMRLGPDGVIDAGGVAEQGAEPVGCECGKCGTKFAAGDIRTAGPELDAKTGRMVVRRSVDCDFCNHVMSWSEGATQAGTPNGRVVAGPFYS